MVGLGIRLEVVTFMYEVRSGLVCGVNEELRYEGLAVSFWLGLVALRSGYTLRAVHE